VGFNRKIGHDGYPGPALHGIQSCPNGRHSPKP
jgi:hypothetical protein